MPSPLPSAGLMTASAPAPPSSPIRRLFTRRKTPPQTLTFERVPPVERSPRDPLVGPSSQPYTPTFPSLSSSQTRRRSSTPTVSSTSSSGSTSTSHRRDCLYLLDFISEGGEQTIPVGAAFPSRKEKREPPPFSNLAPWEEGDGGEEGGELGVEEVWNGTGETVVERVERKGKRRWSGVSGKSLFGGKGREKSGAVELGGGGARGERGQAP